MVQKTLSVLFTLLTFVTFSVSCLCAESHTNINATNCCPSDTHSHPGSEDNSQNECLPCIECGTLFISDSFVSFQNSSDNFVIEHTATVYFNNFLKLIALEPIKVNFSNKTPFVLTVKVMPKEPGAPPFNI
jgi:hypothetical protein